MELNRRVFSSRLSISLIVFLFVCFLAIWSFGSDVNRNIYYPIGIVSLSPLLFWSLREIYCLRDGLLENRKRNQRVCINFLITSTPMLVAFISSIGKEITSFLIGQSFLVIFLFLCVMWAFNKLHEPVLDHHQIKEWFKNKSFMHLNLSAFIFWNSLFFMSLFFPWYWIFISFGIVMLTDVLGYVFGCTWGRNKLSIYSPNKTKEGFWGSIIFVSLLASFLLIFLPPSFRNEILGNKECWWVAILLLPMGLIMCSWGDLYFSMHKRIFGIKDYSNILCSHGGFWDRFDSHVFFMFFLFVSYLIWFLIP